MATQSQIAANRRNSQKSTGPRTQAGKSVSRLNALKSGVDAELDIIPGEDPNALTQLIADYYDRHQPTTPEARFLVDTLITSDWLLRRLRRVEAALWQHDIEDTFEHSDSPLACAAENQDQTFDRLQRRINATLRNYTRAMAELQNLPLDTPPVPELTLVPAAVSNPALVPIGFVPRAAPRDAPLPDPTALRVPTLPAAQGVS